MNMENERIPLPLLQRFLHWKLVMWSLSVFLSSAWPTVCSVFPCRLDLPDRSLWSVLKQVLALATLLGLGQSMQPISFTQGFSFSPWHLLAPSFPLLSWWDIDPSSACFPRGPLAGRPSVHYFCVTVVLCCFSSDCVRVSLLRHFNLRPL